MLRLALMSEGSAGTSLKPGPHESVVGTPSRSLELEYEHELVLQHVLFFESCLSKSTS